MDSRNLGQSGGKTISFIYKLFFFQKPESVRKLKIFVSDRKLVWTDVTRKRVSFNSWILLGICRIIIMPPHIACCVFSKEDFITYT